MANFFRLPEHLSDLPPPVAGRIDRARRAALDWLLAHDYELHIPTLAEYMETLGADDETLQLNIFKITDTISGRTMGIRADHTPQIARFDAARGGDKPRRLCYCGPTLLTRPPQPWKRREIMQLGAEIFNLPPPAADWEIIRLAAGALSAANIHDIAIDIGHAGIIHRLLGDSMDGAARAALCRHWARQDFSILRDKPAAAALLELSQCRGDLTQARRITAAANIDAEAMLDDLAYIQTMLRAENFDVNINFGEIGGYGYHTGIVFGIYGRDFVAARGGRYHRRGFRPATGFSMDLREIVKHAPPPPTLSPPIHCPLASDDLWFAAVAELRRQNRRLRFVDAAQKPPPPILEKNSAGVWKVRES